MKKFAAVAVLAAAFALPCLAVRSNDFTKASNSYSRKYQSDKSRYGEEKSRMQGERAGMGKSFSPKTETSRFQGEAARLDGAAAEYFFDKTAPDASKKFAVKDYSGMSGDWSRGDTRASLKNSDVNLSKKYAGKIDVYRRDTDKQREIDAYYSSISERSMSEINKFYSRTPNSSANDDMIKKAGAQLGGEGDGGGFFDFLSSHEKIKRAPVSFKSRPASSSEFSRKGSAPAETVQTPTPAAVSESAAARRQYVPQETSATVLSRPTQSIRSNVLTEEIPLERAKKLRFLNVPEELRSNASIKVRVKED